MSANRFQYDACVKLACAICESAYIDFLKAKRYLRDFTDFDLLEKVDYYRYYNSLAKRCAKLRTKKKLSNEQKAVLRKFDKMKEPKKKPTWTECNKVDKYWKAQQTISDCIKFWRSEYFINITLGQGDYNAVIERAEKEVLR